MEHMEHPARREPQLAPVIRTAMQSSGFGVRDLANAANISPATLRLRLAGVGSFSFLQACAVARALGMKPSQLFALAESP